VIRSAMEEISMGEWSKTMIAKNYMRDYKINGTITTIGKYGFEYMTYSGNCFYVPYKYCAENA